MPIGRLASFQIGMSSSGNPVCRLEQIIKLEKLLAELQNMEDVEQREQTAFFRGWNVSLIGC